VDSDKLLSARSDVDDPIQAIEVYFQKDWTDGLPVIPPTESRIWAMLDATGKSPGDVLGQIPVRARVITAEKLAINAILAGCLPGYPFVLVHHPMASASPEELTAKAKAVLPEVVRLLTRTPAG